MSTAGPATQTASSPKPRDEELDFFGLTHPGLVRQGNQDHYLVSTLHKTARVRATSLPNPELFELPSQRIASFGMVADGVGGHHGGETASRAAIESITEYVKETMNAFYAADENDEQSFFSALQDAAATCHRSVIERAQASGQPTAATTLTLFVAVWPSLYILHVGDSRMYLYRKGSLQQLTRDQTMAQDLVDLGALPKAAASRSPLAHVLTSAMGGSEASPDVTRVEVRWGDALLLCTDGLTKHVSDERIAERMRTMTSAEQVVRTLVDDALAGGGTDNVTVLVVAGVRKH
jgi:serine/threonine protein phosphatase PrpC